jgi:hypothetical protein
MSETFCDELNLVLAEQGIDEYLICFCSKGNKLSTWTDLYAENLVRVVDLSHRFGLITIPEVNWCTLTTSYQFKLVVFPLRHAKQSSIMCLVSIHSLLLF